MVCLQTTPNQPNTNTNHHHGRNTDENSACGSHGALRAGILGICRNQDRLRALRDRPGLLPRRSRRRRRWKCTSPTSTPRAASTASRSSSSSTTTAAIPTRRAPSPRASIEEDKVERCSAARPPAPPWPIIALVRGGQHSASSHFAGAVQAIVVPVKQMGCSRRRTPSRCRASKIFEDLRKRNLTKMAHDLRHRRARQVDARPVHEGGAEVRHRGHPRGNLRRRATAT